MPERAFQIDGLCRSFMTTALDRIGDVVIVTDGGSIDAPDGPRIIYVNDAFTRVTGFSREEALGATPRILQGPKTQRSELDRIREALVTDSQVRVELLNYTKDGTEFWAEIEISALDLGGERFYLAVQRDVTDRKIEEEKLRASYERFELLSKATSDVTWDWDLASGRLNWAIGTDADFGYAPEEVQQAPDFWKDRIHPEDRSRIEEGWRQSFEGFGPGWMLEYRVYRKDGTLAFVRDKALIIRDADGRPLRVVGSTTDVTHERDIAEKAAQSQKMAAIGELTGGIAHDFNNVLTVILGNAEALSETLPVNDPMYGAVDLMAQAAQRGAQLTHRLLAFASRQALEPQVQDINEVVADSLNLIQRSFTARVELSTSLQEDLWPVLVDGSKLQSALMSLALNARDAMPEGGKLVIRTSNHIHDVSGSGPFDANDLGEYVSLSVSDNGIGMPPEVVARAWEPFFTTKPEGRGSGLGLSTVYGFVKQSNGHVTIDSRPGGGTIVTIAFPRAEHVEINESQPGTDSLGGRERILVVDDDPLVLEFACTQVASLGYRVERARSAREAIKILRRGEPFDLLFTDVVMPGMDGVQLAEQAVQIQPGLRILFTSGYNEKMIFRDLRPDRVVKLLHKPYTRGGLARKIRETFLAPRI